MFQEEKSVIKQKMLMGVGKPLNSHSALDDHTWLLESGLRLILSIKFS